MSASEFFGFLGPNGAGKPTTINMLCTLLRPSAGRAIVNDFDVQRRRSDVRRSIGLVFQQPTVDEYLSAGPQTRRQVIFGAGFGKIIRALAPGIDYMSRHGR